MRRILLVLALVLAAPSVAAAQAKPFTYRDPSTALAYAFLVPGGGHLYAGEAGKGWALFLVGTGSVVGGYVLATRCHETTETLDYGSSTSQDCGPRSGPLVAGAAIYAVTWIIGLTDAGPAARRQNQRHGLAVAPIIEPGRETRLGMRIALGGSSRASHIR